jgi:hypothetical protein
MRRRRVSGGLAVATTLPFWMACASAPAPPSVSAAGPQPSPKQIHDCLLDARRVEPVKALTHQMVIPSRYNACMRDKGWRG